MDKQVKVDGGIHFRSNTDNLRKISTSLVVGGGLSVEHEDDAFTRFQGLHVRVVIDRERNIRREVIHNEFDVRVVCHLHRVSSFTVF